jgi:hypothetical protein
VDHLGQRLIAAIIAGFLGLLAMVLAALSLGSLPPWLFAAVPGVCAVVGFLTGDWAIEGLKSLVRELF